MTWRAPVALWLGFLALGAITLITWTVSDRNAVTGDEPHYLVIADGIVRDLTFEQTATYQREFDNPRFYPAGLAPAGSEPSPETTHAVAGPHGLYNVHNIGLPLLLAVPTLFGGAFGAKLVMVLVAGLLVPLTWRATDPALVGPASVRQRTLVTAGICLSVPFLLASSQIYPDIPAGLGALLVVDRIIRTSRREPEPGFDGGVASAQASQRGPETRAGDPEVDEPVPARIRSDRWLDVAAVAALAYLPWLQIKFSAAALVLAAGWAAAVIRNGWSPARDAPLGGGEPGRSSESMHGPGRRGRSLPSWLGPVARIVAPVGGSLLALASYNHYAFASASGPYEGGALVVDRTSMMVLAGLHLDRFQGLMIQNPLYLLGLVAAVPFIRRLPVAGITIVVTYAAFVVPNALHVNWYGGFSFAGRFAWSGAVVAIPMVADGIARAVRWGRLGQAVVTGSLAVSGMVWWSFTFGDLSPYNAGPVWMSAYPSFHPLVERWLPALHNSWLAYQLPVNALFVLLAVALLVAGGLRERDWLRRWWPAALTLWLVAVVGASSMTSVDEQPRIWAGADLPGDVGQVAGPSRVATAGNGPGFLTFGPYIRLEEGEYRYTVDLQVAGDDAQPSGYVDVFLPDISKQLAVVDLPTKAPPDTPTQISGTFTVTADQAGAVEIRTFYTGTGELAVNALELVPIGPTDVTG